MHSQTLNERVNFPMHSTLNTDESDSCINTPFFFPQPPPTPPLCYKNQRPPSKSKNSNFILHFSMDRTTIEDLHSDVLIQALRKMDGPTLAAAASSSSLLRSLASDSALWRRLCLSTWPSLRHPRLLPLVSASPRRFFSQSFPLPVSDEKIAVEDLPTELISAVDIYHKGIPVFSRVIETDASSVWFLTSPFSIYALDHDDHSQLSTGPAIDRKNSNLLSTGLVIDCKDPNQLSTGLAINPDDLTVSWAVIDPATGSAVNASSRRAVAVEHHWYSCDILVRFAVVLGGHAVSVVVTCGEELGRVREVRMTVEDLDGRVVRGREGLGTLKGAMEGGRRGAKWEEEIKREYEVYVRRKSERIERQVKREQAMDLWCAGFGALMFLSFLMLMAFRSYF